MTYYKFIKAMCLLAGMFTLEASAMMPLVAQHKTNQQASYIASVSQQGPTVEIVVRGQNLRDVFAKVLAIEIKDSENQALIQMIGGIETTTPNGEIYLEDLNFDGYKDLRLQAMIPAGANAPYLYWLYDANQGKFIRNEDLEQVISPEIDLQQKRLISHERISAAEHLSIVYAWQDGKLQPVIKEVTACQEAKDCVKSYYTMANGEWQKTQSLPTTTDANTSEILFTLAEEHFRCKKALRSVRIEPKSEKAILAYDNYVRCLEEIFIKASNTFYPTSTFGANPQKTIENFNRTVDSLYQQMIHCKNDEDCAYYETINAKMSSSNVMQQALATMLLNIGSRAQDFNPNDWQDIWYKEP